MEWIQEELLAAGSTTQGLNWDRRFLQGSIKDFQELAFPQVFRHVKASLDQQFPEIIV